MANKALKTYPDADETPDPDLWFKMYSAAIDIAEGGSGIVALFRHAGIGRDYIYKTQKEIDTKHPEDKEKYFTKVRLPGNGTGSFSTAGFDRAVNNVTDAWRQLYEGLESDVELQRVVWKWSLETGTT